MASGVGPYTCSTMQIHRIAVFFAPAFDQPLWHSGSRWLGRDAGGELFAHDASPVDESLTRAPARYGFHATLKPPFRLRAGIDASTVLAQTQALAATLKPFVMPALSVQRLDDFIALQPANAQDAAMAPLTALAAAAVRELDELRAPPDAQELNARRAGLNTAQTEMLERWGYPFVLDTWRFHMTLTRRLQAADDPAAVLARAERFFAPVLALPLRCDDICLFVEPAPGADLICWRRVRLG